MGNLLRSPPAQLPALYEQIDALQQKVEFLEAINKEQRCTIDILLSKELESPHCEFAQIEQAKREKSYEYLVLSGGGIKGVCYCGALDVLERYHILYDGDGNRKIKGLREPVRVLFSRRFWRLGCRLLR